MLFYKIQPQLNGHSISKTSPNITSINNVNNLNSSFTKVQALNQNISIQKPTQLLTSPVFQYNLPQTYHQTIPSSSYPTTQVSNNSLFIGSSSLILNNNNNNNGHQINQQPLTITPNQNSFNLLNNLNPLTNVLASPTIISPLSYSANFGGGSLSQNWYDSFVDNVDDFLP